MSSQLITIQVNDQQASNKMMGRHTITSPDTWEHITINPRVMQGNILRILRNTGGSFLKGTFDYFIDNFSITVMN